MTQKDIRNVLKVSLLCFLPISVVVCDCFYVDRLWRLAKRLGW